MKTRATLLIVPCALLTLCRCECTPPSEQDSGPADANNRRDAGPGPDRYGVDVTGQDLTGVDVTGQDAGPGDATRPDSAAAIETCSGAPTTSVAAGECELVAGSASSTLIVGTVLTPGRIYENGGLLFDSAGTISCVGCNCFGSGSSARKVVCNSVVVSPGLINAHDHMGWMSDVPRSPTGPAGLRYEHRHDWRKGDPADQEPKITVSGGATTDQKIFGELRFVMGGGTSINGSGTAPGFLRNLDQSGGREGLTEQPVLYSTFPLGDSDGTKLSGSCGYPNFDDPNTAHAANAYTPHVSEGINDYAFNEFLCLSGNASGGQDLLGANTAIIHGIGLSASAIGELAARGAKLIWSPRSNIALYGETAAVTLYHTFGMPIALGTDWIPSGSMSMLRELACAAFLNDTYFGHFFTDEDLWRMVTIDGARATGTDNSIGVLQAGKLADVALFRSAASGPYGSVVRAEPDDLVLVLRGGKVLAGRAALVAALETNCDQVDVCGTPYRICLQREVQKSWPTLQGAVGQMYPLAVCGTPSDEPTCVPYRGEIEAVMGSSVYTQAPGSADLDGDGIANGQDNCPNVFNPKRPFDHGTQGDFDEDQVGDVCDPCPLNANSTTCTPFNPDDPDGDGVNDPNDNCPRVANSDQGDRDDDDRGDVCDACPDTANRAPAGCPTTIFAIQDPNHANHVPVDTAVRVECVVTAVGLKGIWCQDRTGGPYSGIYAYTVDPPSVDPGGGARAPVPGDEVQIDATYAEWYDLSELNSPVLTWVRSGTPLTPAVVSAANVANGGSQAEAYEGVLIRVNGVEVTVQNADAPEDYDELTVTGGLRVDDLIYQDLDNTYAVGTQFAGLVGPLHYSYGNFKILPRDAADLLSGPATLARFSETLSYARVSGSPGSTVPRALYVEMTRAVEADTAIALAATPNGLLQVPASVTVPNGSSRVEVPVQGLAASTTLAHLTATLDSDSAATDVRVLADDTPTSLATLTPTAVTAMTGSTTTFTVGLTLPAPTGGASVGLTAVASGGGDLGTVPSTLSIPFNALSGSFDFVAGTLPAVGAVSATLDHTLGASVTVLDQSALAQDLSGYQLVQTNSAQTYTIPANTKVPIGGYLVIGRNVAKDAFETFWGGAGFDLPSNVVYLNSGDRIPLINGGETFTLKKPGGVEVVDGPSVTMQTNKCYQRKVPVAAPGESSSWNVIGHTAGGGANPGSGQAVGASAVGAYISEYCDAATYANEFVEIHVDGQLP